MKTKSFIFILLVLAAAAVVFFLVWQKSQEPLTQGTEKSPWQSVKIESASVTEFDQELSQELTSFDKDLADLTALDADASLNAIESDLANLEF